MNHPCPTCCACARYITSETENAAVDVQIEELKVRFTQRVPAVSMSRTFWAHTIIPAHRGPIDQTIAPCRRQGEQALVKQRSLVVTNDVLLRQTEGVEEEEMSEEERKQLKLRNYIFSYNTRFSLIY